MKWLFDARLNLIDVLAVSFGAVVMMRTGSVWLGIVTVVVGALVSVFGELKLEGKL